MELIEKISIKIEDSPPKYHFAKTFKNEENDNTSLKKNSQIDMPDSFSKEESRIYYKLKKMEFPSEIIKLTIKNNKELFTKQFNNEDLLAIFIERVLQTQKKFKNDSNMTKKSNNLLIQKINSFVPFVKKENFQEDLTPKSQFSINTFSKKTSHKEIKSEYAEEGFEECQICYTLHSKQYWERIPKISICKHKFCEDCLHEYTKNLIYTGQVLEMKCPNAECKAILKESEIEIFLNNEELFLKYQKFCKIKQLSKNPAVCWCINPGCEKFNFGTKSQPKVICDCGTIICFNCRGAWHENISCEAALNKEYRHFANKKHVQLCPQCKSRIEKDGGCNHMVCGKCEYEFCWICGGKYSEIHYKAWNMFGCPGQMYRTSVNLRCRWGGKILTLLLMILRNLIIMAIILSGFSIFVVFYIAFCVFACFYSPWIFLREFFQIRERQFILFKIVLLPILYPISLVFAIFPGSIICYFLIIRDTFENN